jgi:peptidoglycan/xylan/chitin deacetylase (PgdA/CDA1 family)
VKKVSTKKLVKPSFLTRVKKEFTNPITLIRTAVVLVIIIVLFTVLNSPNQPVESTISPTPVTPTSIQPAPVNKQVPTVLQAITSSEVLPAPTGVKVPVLYYHYIEINPNPVGDPGRTTLSVTPENFDSQLNYLKSNGYTTISLSDLVTSFNNPKILPAKPIILTFDDGYSDFYQNAWPIIQKYEMKSTLYVVSRANKTNPSLYLSDQEIIDLSKSPLITIACHTQDHKDLRGGSVAFQRDEIFGCKADLEALIGQPVRNFAYPYGSFDMNSIHLVKEAGFETAASTSLSAYNNLETVFTLHRIRMGNWSGSSPSFQNLINLNH